MRISPLSRFSNLSIGRLPGVLSGVLLAGLLFAGSATAAEAVRVEPPQGPLGWLTDNYRAATVPPIDLSNSSRLTALERAGNLYLSAQDAIALAIENNLDIEVQRYGPLLAEQVLKRAEGGGALRSVGVGVAPGPQSVSLAGVSVAGIGAAGTAGQGVSSGGGIVTQLGPLIPSFDPSLTFSANFAHTTSAQSNTVLTGTTALVQGSRNFQASYTQNWSTGTSATLSYANQSINSNSLRNLLNPYTSGDVDLQVTQNLLNGFGSAVNRRNILVQKNNIKVTDLQFKQQLIVTISSVLNLYWDLVSFDEDVRARQREVDAAQRLLDNNKKQVDAGTLAPIEVTRAEAQLYTSQQDLLVAQTNLLQQETVLKNALSRNGVASPEIKNVHIVPLDTIQIPPSDEVAQTDQLMGQALGDRPEIAQSRLNIDSNKINLVGIKNALRPTVQVFAELTNNALAGALTPIGAGNPSVGYLAGGYGDLLGQIFRRNFPNYSAGISLNIPIRNRAAQSDYVTSQLELRQSELGLQQNINQVRVDVQNAVIGLRQARARYEASQKALVLQQQTQQADEKRYALGAQTSYQLVLDQQNVANAENLREQALANYSHARIAFDQAMGTTLQVNNVSINEALAGKVSRQSVLPATLPQENRP